MSQASPVRKRKVFFLPGYDPMPARHYREIYRREAALQAGISGYELSVQALGGEFYGWKTTAGIGGVTTVTEIEFLKWNDIVLASMQAGILASYWLLLRTLWLYLRTGALFALFRLRPAPMIAALYPVGMLGGQLLLAIALGLLAGWLARYALVYMALPFIEGWPMLEVAYLGMALVVIAVAIGIAVFILALKAFKARDNRIYAYYLLYVYAFSAWHAGGYPPALRARMQNFKARIAAALTQGNDEVLIVGHSVGAHLGVELLAEMEREGMIEGNTPLSLLTLGEVIPMISYLPAARGLRRRLHELGESTRVFWLDITAPGDGGCFALCDPVAVSGVGKGPKVISAAFSQTLKPETFASRKRAFFKLHFQYLSAFDRPGIYDYFSITAGPKTLEARFGAQPDSPSKRTQCFSKYTDMADD